MIIAEVGLNHLGVPKLAHLYVDKLIATDIDAITFQVREEDYYLNDKEKYLLEEKTYIELVRKVHSNGKQLGIAIADVSKIEFFEKIKIDFYKVIRNDIRNIELIDRLIETNKKLIISTGTCSEDEISTFIAKYNQHNITINHTQLSYDIEDCNLSAIKTLREKFKVNVSYGSHCKDSKVLYMALAFNPTDILFYVKAYEFSLWPDNKHSVTLEQAEVIISDLKRLSAAVGTGTKEQMEIKL